MFTVFNKAVKIIPSKVSQQPEVFYKKGVIEHFVKFAGKHLCQSLFFNKVAATVLKSNLSIGAFL